MLSTRIITAVVIAVPFLALMFFAPRWMFEVAVAAIMVAGAWEWASLMACTTRRGRIVFTTTVGALVVLVAWGLRAHPAVLPAVVAVAVAWWAFVLGWLALRPHEQPPRSVYALKGVCGLLTLVPAFAAVSVLHRWDGGGPWLLLYLLALVWLADIGAYLFGRTFGRHKLAPRVSPGKTWEGVLGAYVAAVLVVTAGWLGGIGVGPLWYFVVLAALTVAASIVGDLAESMFKRQQGVKDSGTLLPGHGGVLDRIDSLTAAAPLFVGGLLVAEAL